MTENTVIYSAINIAQGTFSNWIKVLLIAGAIIYVITLIIILAIKKSNYVSSIIAAIAIIFVHVMICFSAFVIISNHVITPNVVMSSQEKIINIKEPYNLQLDNGYLIVNADKENVKALLGDTVKIENGTSSKHYVVIEEKTFKLKHKSIVIDEKATNKLENYKVCVVKEIVN